MSRVELRKLVKRYGGFQAVKGIDLTVEEGEFVVLLGPSGCGKTTTLRCIAGLEETTDGEIWLGGAKASGPDFTLPPEERNIGMVFQSYAIWPHLTVFENVAFGLRIRRRPKDEIERRVSEVLEMVGLAGFAGRGASQLSGGQQQRVALARAFVLEPRVLLFDEPLSNLDAKLRERMRFEVRQLQQRLGITSIYVTHDQQEAMVVADRIVLMHEGEIAHIGTPREIYESPRTRFGAEFIGLANILPGEILESGAQSSVIRLSTGAVIHARATKSSAGAAVEVIFRPEQLRLSPPGEGGSNVLKGTVLSTFYLGNSSDIELDCAGLLLRGQISPPGTWAPGDAVQVNIPCESVSVLPRQQ